MVFSSLSGDPLLTCGLVAAHTPDNSFMGFVSEELNETEKQLIKDGKASNMAVVYGKEASIWKVSMAAARRAPRHSHLQDSAPIHHPQHWARKTSAGNGSENRSLTATGNPGLEACNLPPLHPHSLPQTQMSFIEDCDLTVHPP